MKPLACRACELAEKAAEAGYPNADTLLALTPREIGWRLTAFAAGKGVKRASTDKDMARVMRRMAEEGWHECD